MLKILTTYHCAKCKDVKERLKDKEIPFTECPADDPKGMELVIKHRIMTAPALFITEENDASKEETILTNYEEILSYIEKL